MEFDEKKLLAELNRLQLEILVRIKYLMENTRDSNVRALCAKYVGARTPKGLN